MKQIVPNLYTLEGMVVGRVYLIQDADGLTLIDASLPISAGKILNQIKQLNQPLKRILITHAHPDHIGALPDLKKATNAQIFCSALEKPIIEGKNEIPRVPANQISFPSNLLRPPRTFAKPTLVDQVVEDGYLFDHLFGGLQVIATPGHAPGHIAFWQPQRRILFCGDVLFNAPKFRLPFAGLTVDMAENIRSVKKIAQLDPDIICFGHGQPMQNNATQRLREFVAQL